MENKLHTQEELTSEEERIKSKEKVFKEIKDNINYIYIFLMIIANALISLLKIDKDSSIGIRYPKTGAGWALWVAQIVTITFIGVMILNAFRRQGVKNGHKVISTTYQEYLNAIVGIDKDVDPRSLQEYMTERQLRDTLTKGTTLVLINVLVISAVIEVNLNAVLALVINILFACSFGIKAMLDAEDYVITELVVWYKLKIKKIKSKKEKKINE